MSAVQRPSQYLQATWGWEELPERLMLLLREDYTMCEGVMGEYITRIDIVLSIKEVYLNSGRYKE